MDARRTGRADFKLGHYRLLALIDEAAKLPPPQEFDQPRTFRRDDGSVIATCRGLRDAIDQLKRLGKPFLNWAGKAERLSFDVPTLPLFVHERLSTMAILETLKDHKGGARPAARDVRSVRRPAAPDRRPVLQAYEYRDKWVNRMILGDSLVVMNSLLDYEGLGGQVQMIYIDPPYGVKFGSNFQPFVRKRDVDHNDDDDMTREPEMVKAYRDTWELGLHSYLTYLRDRLLLARDLLHPSGSVFVQIGGENLHHVRELMDESFSERNLHKLTHQFRHLRNAETEALLEDNFNHLLDTVEYTITQHSYYFCRNTDLKGGQAGLFIRRKVKRWHASANHKRGACQLASSLAGSLSNLTLQADVELIHLFLFWRLMAKTICQKRGIGAPAN